MSHNERHVQRLRAKISQNFHQPSTLRMLAYSNDKNEKSRVFPPGFQNFS